MTEEQLLQGSRHCGAVRLTLPAAPEKATKCNCSICRRLGGLWAYYEFGTVRIEGHPEHTSVAAFLAFASNHDYLSGMGHRLAALVDSRLLPMVEEEA